MKKETIKSKEVKDWKAGDSFAANISVKKCKGMLQLENGCWYLCQNKKDGAECENKLGYQYSWGIGTGHAEGIVDNMVTDLLVFDTPCYRDSDTLKRLFGYEEKSGPPKDELVDFPWNEKQFPFHVMGCDPFTSQHDNTKPYNHINPSHYKRYSHEVIDMMVKIYGLEAVALYCEMNAFKYTMRVGMKPDQPIERDVEKRDWYLNKSAELRK